jgi:hypothetical protein
MGGPLAWRLWAELAVLHCKKKTASYKVLHRVSERVLRTIFEINRGEIVGDWRKLHNEELHNLYSSRYSITMIKPRHKRWAGHVAHRRKEKHMQTFSWKI